MQALILAGGEGTRLRPLTSAVPKPVVPLVNRPFISYMTDWLVRHGIDDIVLSCGFGASGVRAVLGEGEDAGFRLRYVTEPEPLGTAGAVKFAERMLDERFLVLNGDILADFDLTALWEFHAEREARVTIALIRVDDPSAYGLVRTDDARRITGFLEKPRPEEIDTDLINAGAYVVEREVLETVAEGRAVSFEREVFPALIASGLYGFPADGYWLDIGTPERYLEGTRDILEGTVATAVGAALGDGRLGIGSQAVVNPGAHVQGPSLVGEGCEIEAGARVGPLAVLGEGCRVAGGAVVEDATLHAGVELERDVAVRRSIIAGGARVGARSRVEGGTIVGRGAVIDPGSLLDGERVLAGVEPPPGQ